MQSFISEFFTIKENEYVINTVATEGAVLKYTNGTYKYYSNDGFGRLDKIN